ncbi:hypothetical protein MMC11_002350 [Xylographa trunciseda]|nr:hypothetical protein [Xylographa trunciseda]
MSRRRYFLLDETCPASEVQSMMGRVVKDIRLPLNRFAPVEPLDSATTRHNTQDILPSILPEPSCSSTRKDVLEAVTERGVNFALTSFFGIDLASSATQKAELESMEVKQYSLKQPFQIFQHLMKDPNYGRDVLALLNESWRGKAFMVVGFLTTSGSVWKLDNRRSLTTALTANVPVSMFAGTPSALDPAVSPRQSATNSQSRTMSVAQEEIFAVAYNVVKLRRQFDGKAPRYVKKSAVFGGSRRAKSSEQALGEDSDDEVEGDESSSDDASYDFGTGLSAGMRDLGTEEEGAHFEMTE